MDLRTKWIRNREDVARFGLGFLKRHAGRFTPEKIGTVNIGEFGPISMRCGESDADVVRQVFGRLEYEVQPPAVQARFTEHYNAIVARGETPVIVDAGANIGAASIWFSKLYPEARIVSVEPERDNAVLLRRNVGRLPNVIVIEAAIGSHPGFVTVRGSSAWSIQTSRTDQGIRIVTMAEAFDGGTPFIAKVDIEGFESDLFASNTDWLDDVFSVIVEPHDWMLPGQRTSRSLQRAMAQRDFDLFVRGENLIYVNMGISEISKTLGA